MLTPVVQRWRARRDSYRPAGEPIDPRAYEVAEIPDDRTARAFVERHHYSASYPAARFRFGLYTAGDLVGVAVLSVPVRVEALRPLPMDYAVALELGRLVLLDRVPSNGESWFVARAVERLVRQGLAGVVMFSDPAPRTTADGAVVKPGHLGTIYQALNATYLGQQRPDTLRLLPDGTALPSRALAKIRARERGWRPAAARLEAHGADAPWRDTRAWLAHWLPRLTRTTRHPGNHKYVLGFDRAVRRALPASRPYPKFDIAARDVE